MKQREKDLKERKGEVRKDESMAKKWPRKDTAYTGMLVAHGCCLVFPAVLSRGKDFIPSAAP